ncbi:nuclear transport factor 2 family protein [Streptomyces sp. NBC_01578]|uniref:nuclear transport factor 2 family protein n=1 Tax=Streptomyces sp. NBC_01578 TaxID=2975884 RepID=UPI00386BDFCF
MPGRPWAPRAGVSVVHARVPPWNLREIEALWDRIQARDWSGVADLVAEDVVVEWPVRAERIVGNKNFVAVNSEYPGGWSIRVLRIVADGSEVVSEVEVPHDEFGVFRVASFWTATVTSGPGTRRGGTSPQPGSVSSTPTPSCGSGHPCGALPDAAKSTRRPTWRSPAWSPTAPHSGPPGAGRAPHSSSSATAPADHTPAEPPGQHVPTSFSPEVVNDLSLRQTRNRIRELEIQEQQEQRRRERARASEGDPKEGTCPTGRSAGGRLRC